jgi:hypothetical protein
MVFILNVLGISICKESNGISCRLFPIGSISSSSRYHGQLIPDQEYLIVFLEDRP